ncbi:MAG: hypothetical protein ILP02_00755, partial [Clostridia bacterium]|nr:hypothetical protein [Clostridia bacterium]
LCDRIAIIRRGEILCVKTVEEIESGMQGANKLEHFYMQTIEGTPQNADAPADVGVKPQTV